MIVDKFDEIISFKQSGWKKVYLLIHRRAIGLKLISRKTSINCLKMNFMEKQCKMYKNVRD